MNDELLDQVIARLRDEPVPKMPRELTLSPALPSPRRRMRDAAIVGALAASLLIAGWQIWSAQQNRDDEAPVARRSAVVRDSGADVRPPIVVRQINLTEPLTRLEAGLTAIDAEIAALRLPAALLDARRQANELTARFRSDAAVN